MNASQRASMLSAAIAAALLASACSAVAVDPRQTTGWSAVPSAALVAESAATIAPTARAAPPSTTPASPPTPDPTSGSGVTAPGGGALAAKVMGGGRYPTVTVVGPGWQVNGGSFVDRSSGPLLGISVWDVGQVPRDPCHWLGQMYDPGRTIDDLVRALVAQPLRHASKPKDVTLAGYPGRYLEWSVPGDMVVTGDADFKTCDVQPSNGHRDFVSWLGSGKGERYQQVAGQVDRLWVLDVDGQRLVVDATHTPDATPADLVDQERIVESLRFMTQRPPAVVPENGEIAVSANPPGVGGGEVGDIYLVGGGAAARRIIGSDGDGIAQACPRFSPGGGRLAYGEARASDPVTTFRGEWPVTGRAVVVVGLPDVRGNPYTPLMRVTPPPDPVPGPIPCPEWSPDGVHLAFTLDAELWVVDAVTGETKVSPVTRTSGTTRVELEWSRDGSFIAVAEPGQIRLVRMDGSTSNLIPVEGATPSSLGWTAGDERIIYIGNDASGDGLAVNSVGVGGGSETQLTPDSAGLQVQYDYGAVSPDGTRVAYVKRTLCANDSCSQDPWRLLTSDTDGSNVIEVPIPIGYGVSGPQWSPDGKRLLVVSNDSVVSIAVAPGSPAVVESKGELNLEWSWSEVTWQP